MADQRRYAALFAKGEDRRQRSFLVTLPVEKPVTMSARPPAGQAAGEPAATTPPRGVKARD